MKLQTPEGSAISLFVIWWIVSVLFSASIVLNAPTGSYGFSNAFLFLAVLSKIIVVLLLWGGPSMFHCWLGINCDNDNAYHFTESCLYGPQLLKLNRHLGVDFQMPRPNKQSRCRYAVTTISQESQSIMAIPGCKKQCFGPHNCITNHARLVLTVVFCGVTALSWVNSLVMVAFVRRKTNKQ